MYLGVRTAERDTRRDFPTRTALPVKLKTGRAGRSGAAGRCSGSVNTLSPGPGAWLMADGKTGEGTPGGRHGKEESHLRSDAAAR